MKFLVSILKSVAIGLLGYLLIALGQTLVLEVLLGGRLAPDASPIVLIAATMGTVVSGLLGGYLTAWMGRARPMLHTSIVVGLLALDAVFVVTRGVDGHPLLFDLGGALTLMLATAAGGWLCRRRREVRLSTGPALR